MKIIALTSLLSLIQWVTHVSPDFPSGTIAETHLSTVREPAAADNRGIVFFSSDNGASWKNTSNGLPADAKIGLGAIAVGEGIVAIAVRNYGVYLFNEKLNRWKEIPMQVNIVAANPAALIFHKQAIYLGTQHAGVFSSKDNGKHWQHIDAGLVSQTIRRFVEIDNKLYAGTNAGLFSYNEHKKQWVQVYGNNTMQVNGITADGAHIWIGTNQGAFFTSKMRSDWQQGLAGHSLHNISTVGNTLYAMTYNELFASTDGGTSWKSVQQGMPHDFYTFNVVASQGTVFAGQWDGVYRKVEGQQRWERYGSGLPPRFALTNMKTYKGFLIVSGSEAVRK
ncbi:hypothetical protein SAMN05428949_7408 [Chitinophaga sp. YR627]|uniref:WD40/YVTN/BNR-like repeat-containing protein n=1 Tax=Chitinophaga sp. YR627 TaxID=1881041 RepID=UPI0008E5D3FE|nr:hypothetical protein [Chitinophaga sp. YR627]SFP12043.1 hypothetical protein SAMN05428949_7408 [Chitinophaga sp. YR627]